MTHQYVSRCYAESISLISSQIKIRFKRNNSNQTCCLKMIVLAIFRGVIFLMESGTWWLPLSTCTMYFKQVLGLRVRRKICTGLNKRGGSEGIPGCCVALQS